MSARFDPLPDGPFDIVIADPPWEHPGTNTGPNRSAGAASYPIVKLKDLCALPVASVIADRAQLYLWTSGPILMQAPVLAEAWGFERYATIPFVWDKMKRTVGWYTLPAHCRLVHLAADRTGASLRARQRATRQGQSQRTPDDLSGAYGPQRKAVRGARAD